MPLPRPYALHNRCAIAPTVLLLLYAQTASAECVLRGARLAEGLDARPPRFSFVASDDCESLTFVVRGTPISEVPKPGPDTGAKPRTHQVILTPQQWARLLDSGRSSITWTITGTSSTGTVTKMTTTSTLARAWFDPDLQHADARLFEEAAYDGVGWSVAGAGDVDGDGWDDVLISAGSNDEGGSNAGAAYLLRGPIHGDVDLSSADAKLVGEESGDDAFAVAGVGDVDADGHDDLVVGAPNNDGGGSFGGATYLALGPITGTLDLAAADAKLVGEASYDRAGVAVAGAGDVNGDGHRDILVGAISNDEGGRDAGAAYVVLGPLTGERSLADADAKLVGRKPYDAFGWVAGAGDTDADGNDDVLVSAPFNSHSYSAGGVFAMLGPVTGTVDASAADVALLDTGCCDEGDYAVAGAGDVDGDGHDDVLVGKWMANTAYLILGPITGGPNLARRADAVLYDDDETDWFGTSVAGAGDVDADGLDDILVGDPRDDDGGSSSGAVYLVHGPVAGHVRFKTRPEMKFYGAAYGEAGWSVAGAGDVDHDGHDDILIGSPGDGVVYLLYGG